MPKDFNESDIGASMHTVCDTCSMRSACRDRDNHRTRNILHNLIAVHEHLHATNLIVQVFPTDSKVGVQRSYPLPFECPRTLVYGSMTIRLDQIMRHRDHNIYYAIANTTSSLIDVSRLLGQDGWEMAEDVPFLTEA